MLTVRLRRNHCINLDGFGVAWIAPGGYEAELSEGGAVPGSGSGTSEQAYSSSTEKLTRTKAGDTDKSNIVTYYTLQPPFNDANFLQVAHFARAHCLFAHIRASDVPAKYNSVNDAGSL